MFLTHYVRSDIKYYDNFTKNILLFTQNVMMCKPVSKLQYYHILTGNESASWQKQVSELLQVRFVPRQICFPEFLSLKLVTDIFLCKLVIDKATKNGESCHPFSVNALLRKGQEKVSKFSVRGRLYMYMSEISRRFTSEAKACPTRVH